MDCEKPLGDDETLKSVFNRLSLKGVIGDSIGVLWDSNFANENLLCFGSLIVALWTNSFFNENRDFGYILLDSSKLSLNITEFYKFFFDTVFTSSFKITDSPKELGISNNLTF